MVGFGLLHNPFGDTMVHIFAETGFTPRKFLEMSFCRFRPVLLQALSKGVQTLSCLLNGLPTEHFTRTVSSQVDGAKINAECICHFIGRRCRTFQRHTPREHSLTIAEITFSLYTS